MAQDKSDASLPFGGIVALLLFASGMFVQHVPLDSDRRSSAVSQSRPSTNGQVIEARLWQDPFDALQRSDEATRGEGKTDTAAGKTAATGRRVEHQPTWFRDNVATKIDDSTLVLPVMVFGGPYAEDIEERRRTRYAVLAALRAADYKPVHSRGVGAVRLDRDSFWCTGHESAKEECEFLKELQQVEVPFEQWQALDAEESKKDASTTSTRWKKVLVLWLKEEWFAEQATERMKDLLAKVLFKNQWSSLVDGQIRVIGPTSPTTARSLLDSSPTKVCANLDENRIGEKCLRFISPSLTDPAKDLHAQRMSPGDDAIVKALIKELGLRNIRLERQHDDPPCDQIALLVEADTHFGRSLEQQFEQQLKPCATEKSSGYRVFRYFRGLDGKTAHRTEAEKKKQLDSNGKDIATAPQEQAQGDGQFDYLLRIATRLRESSDRLHLRGNAGFSMEEHGLRAVVVLGSDVHDKLAIFHALREQLPDVVFATNDLDAGLTQRDQLAWTRNVVVASGYGLGLKQLVRDGAPYFRNTYQTASFAATRLALLRGGAESTAIEKALADERKQVKVFEIGNSREIQLDRPLPPSHSESEFWRWLRGGLMVFSGIALLLALSWCVRSAINQTQRRIIPAAALFLLGGYIALVYVVAGWKGEEPLSLTEGISIWPSEFIRLAALLLALYAFRVAHAGRLAAEKEIGEKYFRPGTHATEAARESTLASIFPVLHRSAGETKVNVAALWSRYLNWTADSNTLLRLAAMAVCALILSACLIAMDPPVSPVRGELSRWIDRGTMFVAVLAIMLLLIYVLDRVVMTSLFLKQLWGADDAPQTSDWKGRPGVERCFGEVKWSAEHLATKAAYSYIDFRLSARLTQHVVDAIVYPFALTVLLILARARYFDAWQTPLGLLLVISLGLAALTAAAFSLRTAAEHIRRETLSELSCAEIHLRAQAAPPAGTCPSSEQLKQLREIVAEFKEGAFAPLTSQPIVRALALPFGGLGLVGLLDWATFVR